KVSRKVHSAYLRSTVRLLRILRRLGTQSFFAGSSSLLGFNRHHPNRLRQGFAPRRRFRWRPLRSLILFRSGFLHRLDICYIRRGLPSTWLDDRNKKRPEHRRSAQRHKHFPRRSPTCPQLLFCLFGDGLLSPNLSFQSLQIRSNLGSKLI